MSINCIAPILLDGQRKVYATTLMLLFGAVIVDLATSWGFLRYDMIVHDDDWGTIEDFIDGNQTIHNVITASSRIAIFLADVILVSIERSTCQSSSHDACPCRCGGATVYGRAADFCCSCFSHYSLEKQVCFECHCDAESYHWWIWIRSALIPIISVPTFGPRHYNPRIMALGTPAFYLLSLAVTILATGLIIYRILSVVKQSEGEGSKYSLTIEMLVESGVLYASSLAITSVLFIRSELQSTIGVQEACVFWQIAILPPITVRSA